jgi:hypothetical protein
MREPDPPDAIQRIDEDDIQPQITPGVPSDLRDAIEGTQETLRPAVAPDDPLIDVDEKHLREGTYTTEVPTGVRRPRAPAQPNSPQVTRDPTLSRAIDAEAAGIDPTTLGFDETHGEAGHPGPLAPTADDQEPAAEGEPAGKYGSSGAPTS